MIVFVTEKKGLGALLTSSRVVNSEEEKPRGLRQSPLIEVLKFMTNGKEHVVIRVGRLIFAGGWSVAGGRTCIICSTLDESSGRVNRHPRLLLNSPRHSLWIY